MWFSVLSHASHSVSLLRCEELDSPTPSGQHLVFYRKQTAQPEKQATNKKTGPAKSWERVMRKERYQNSLEGNWRS